MEKLIDLIGEDCWEIIQDYKTQLDITEKYDKVMRQLKRTYKYQYTRFDISEMNGKEWLVLYIYDEDSDSRSFLRPY